MRRFAEKVSRLALLVALLLATSPMPGRGRERERPKEPPFKYAGGTEDLREGCNGNLEVTSTGLSFVCPQGSITAPFTSITIMQFRPDIAKEIWKLKLKWKVFPPSGGGRKNRLFSVVYSDHGRHHAMVLEVSPKDMMPYLAEIDLKSGRRVEVKGYEDYD